MAQLNHQCAATSKLCPQDITLQPITQLILAATHCGVRDILRYKQVTLPGSCQ
jgi:hypothetical protein